jgi:hypothetical protein
MREFEFQVTMLASIRVKAATQVEADRKLRVALAASEANLGMLDNEPIVCPIDVEAISTCFRRRKARSNMGRSVEIKDGAGNRSTPVAGCPVDLLRSSAKSRPIDVTSGEKSRA